MQLIICKVSPLTRSIPGSSREPEAELGPLKQQNNGFPAASNLFGCALERAKSNRRRRCVELSFSNHSWS